MLMIVMTMMMLMIIIIIIIINDDQFCRTIDMPKKRTTKYVVNPFMRIMQLGFS